MDTLGSGEPLQIGAAAPDFKLAMLDRDELVGLADYRGRSPLLLGLFRGIYCAFCRRAVAKLGLVGDRPSAARGIETLAVIGTKLENARVYYRYHPTRMAIAVDPDLATHRAYGLPRIEASWGDSQLEAESIPPANSPKPLPLWETTKALGRLDGFKPTDTDRDDGKRAGTSPLENS